MALIILDNDRLIYYITRRQAVAREATTTGKEKRMAFTSLSKWDPFWDVIGLQNRVARPLGDLFTRSPLVDSNAWFPAVDISEENDQLVLRAEIPGVSKDDIDLQVENGTFTLRGEKRQATTSDEENTYRSERFFGTFSRSFVLPTSVDAGAIRATYKDGVLEVVLPKAAEARPRKIEVVPA